MPTRGIRRIRDEVSSTNQQRSSSMDTPSITSPVENVKDVEKKGRNYFSPDRRCSKVGVDTEYFQRVKNEPSIFTHIPISFYDEYYLPVLTVIFVNPELPLPWSPDLTVECRYWKEEELVNLILACGIPMASTIYLYFYFACKDIEGVFGRAKTRKLFLEPGLITRKRNVTGQFPDNGHEFILCDLYGMFNSSLDDALKSVGIHNPYKDLVEQLGYSKKDMFKFAMERPNEAVKYTEHDSKWLGLLFTKRVDQINEVNSGALGIAALFSYDNVPKSFGALVSKTFEGWLIQKYPELYRAVMMLSDSANDKAWPILRAAMTKLNDKDCDLDRVNRTLRGNDQIIHGLGMASIKNYALIGPPNGLTAVYNAVVQGGRCNNENPHDNPYDNRVSNVIDLDNSSCYGSTLEKYDIPFGIPKLIGFDKDDVKTIKLGVFLKKYKKRFVKNLWKIHVNGMLSVCQDLLYSKCDLNTEKMMKSFFNPNDSLEDYVMHEGGRELAEADIGGSFELNTKELTLAVITEDVLERLLAYASEKELKEIYNLDVVCAAYYDAEDELSIDEWTKVIFNPRTRGYKSQGVDTRTRKWCRLPIKEFIGSYLQYRKKLKASEGGTVKGHINYLLQNATKLFVNTFFGCLASRYFPMGNTILADNITARARVGGWELSKAMLLSQLITDGGISSANQVIKLAPSNGKLYKPSLATLADRELLLKHRSVNVVPLLVDNNGEPVQIRDWLVEDNMSHYKERCKKLDLEVNKVVKDFLANWGLEPLFDVECKYEHTGREAVYFSKADYQIYDVVQGELDKDKPDKTKGFCHLNIPDDEPWILSLSKSRGAHGMEHPKHLWLSHLLRPDVFAIPEGLFEEDRMVMLNQFKKNPGDLMPGENQTSNSFHMPYSSGRLPETHADRLKDDEAQRKQSAKHKRDYLEGNRYGYAHLAIDGKLTPNVTPPAIKGKRIVTNFPRKQGV